MSLKVIHTIGSLHANTGGPPRTVVGLCSVLSSARLDVELITYAQGANEPQVLPNHESIRMHFVARQSPLKAFFPVTSRFVRTLAERISSGSDAIVHDHGIWL